MIAVSNDFKTAMKEPVKELQAYITGDTSIRSGDDLISFKVSCESGLCKTAMRKLEAKYTGEHNLLGQWVHVGFGVKLSTGAFEYLDYGSFLITEITTVKDTGVTTVIGYDKMINSMKNYQVLDVEYPIDLYTYTQRLCEACDLELGNESFTVHSDWLINGELWENIDGITYRDIFVQIAQVTGTTCIISNDDKVYFKPINLTGEVLTYDNMFKLKLEPVFGEINSVVLSRTPQEDNIFMRDEESIRLNGLTEFKIENNEIVDKDRDNAMTPIYNALKGISYYPFETTTEGLGWYEIADNIDIINDTGDVFNTTLFNFNITIDGSIKEILKTSAETKTQTQYQYATTIAKRIKNTEIITNKQEQYIKQLVSDMYEENGVINKNFTEVYQDITNIINKVQNSGGTNLIKNSVMFAYDNNNKPNDWEISHAAKNLTNINFEQGAYGFSDGVKYEYGNYIRTANKIPVVAGETYTLSFKGTQPQSWDSGFIFFKDGVYVDCLATASLTFTVPEGVNQMAYDLCGSTSISPSDVWDIQLEKGSTATEYEPYIESNIIMDSNVESLNAGGVSGHSFTLINKIASQRVFVTPNTFYTFSTRIKKGLDGSCYVKLYNASEEHLIEIVEGEESFYKEYELKSLLPKENYYIVEFYGSSDSNTTFTDNMLAVGEYKSQWSQANGEIMNTQVNVNLDGVLVKSSVYLGDYTVMSPLEFAGYSNINGTITKVFSLNKDTTLVKKLEAEDEIKMVPIKVVPITSGDLLGWAFVPSTKEV